MSKEIHFCAIFFCLKVCILNDYSYFCDVSSHQASQRCSNAWGFFVYIRLLSKYANGNITAFHETLYDRGRLDGSAEKSWLVISDEDKAVRYLESIGYYRLSAYMYPFLKALKETHQYKDGTTFQQVLNFYRFDKKLRMLLLNEIEKVEIAIRRAIMNIPVQMTGDSYWLTNSVHFANQRTFQETKNTIDREYAKSTEDFIKHFKNSYCDPYPPSWILGELLTMGNVNMIYRNLKADKIALGFPSCWENEPLWQ